VNAARCSIVAEPRAYADDAAAESFLRIRSKNDSAIALQPHSSRTQLKPSPTIRPGQPPDQDHEDLAKVLGTVLRTARRFIHPDGVKWPRM